MKKTNLNLDWLFMNGEKSNIPMMQQQTKEVNLPHDFMVETDVTPDAPGKAESGFYKGSAGTYLKTITLTEEEMTDTMLLHFEGCFGKTRVLINGNPVGSHAYGYTPFTIDIRKFLQIGDNEIQVIVHTDDDPNGRWYSGSGMYRGVNLLSAPAFHIAHDGIFVYTDHITNGDAFCKAEITVVNDLAKATGDAEGFLKLTVSKKDTKEVVATRYQKIRLTAGTSQVVPQAFVIENAELWDTENPYLYEVKAQLSLTSTGNVHMSLDNRQDLMAQTDYEDEITTRFGVRTITADAKNGLLLNGKSIKLKGGCIHHDNGILGAASFYDAEYRKVKLHKDNGYNALRLAHNPQSEQILDICDELGMIVFDEAFDVWNLPKNSFDFSHQFAEDGIKEIEAMVRRDRNHPSIFFWSIGNELTEQGGMAAGYEVSAMLAKTVRNMDSTRLVSGALCSFFKGLDNEDNAAFWQTFRKEMPQGGSVINMDNSYGKKIWMEYTAPFVKDWDVVGYNYLNYHYETSHELFPDRVILCTESKPGQFEDYWSDVERLPYVIGDFLWTSMDYIGEAGIGKSIYCSEEEVPQMSQMLNYAGYPWRLAQAGDFDLCGNVRAQGRYHQIIWGANDTYIFAKNPKNNGKIALIGRYGWAEGGNHWSWNCENGTAVSVDVYSRAEEVELLLNGKSLGKKPAGAECHFKAEFEVTYEAGTLTAISYQDGQEVSRDEVKTVGEPVGLKITMEKNQIAADGESLAYGIVEIVDTEGNWVPTAEDTLAKVSVEGAASLAGFGTGRGQTEENYTKGEFTSFEGRWQVILRAGIEAGEAGVHVEAEGLEAAEVKVTIV